MLTLRAHATADLAELCYLGHIKNDDANDDDEYRPTITISFLTDTISIFDGDIFSVLGLRPDVYLLDY